VTEGTMEGEYACARDSHIFAPGPKRILALDGGGVRGIISLAYLERIETLLRGKHGSALKLCDWFALVGGTSTGSIIATGLAMGMDVSALIDIYINLSAQGFQGSRWHGGYFVPKFKTKPLMDAIRGQIGDTKLGSPDIRTALAIVAKRLDTGSVWTFHNNPKGAYFGTDAPTPEFTPNKDIELVRLVRASTAAPTFFAPERISVAPGIDGVFVDGGVSPHNNPALLLFMLATIKGFGFRWKTGADNLRLISVGTGYHPMSPDQVPGSWKPSVLLAVTGLRSILEDNSWLVQTMMQWLGQNHAPWMIDGEIGDLRDDQLGPEPLLRYERYDVELTDEWLQRALNLKLSAKELAQLQTIDDPKYAQAMLKLGRAAAAVQIREETFLAD
jgi:hypothetical protein